MRIIHHLLTLTPCQGRGMVLLTFNLFGDLSLPNHSNSFDRGREILSQTPTPLPYGYFKCGRDLYIRSEGLFRQSNSHTRLCFYVYILEIKKYNPKYSFNI